MLIFQRLKTSSVIDQPRSITDYRFIEVPWNFTALRILIMAVYGFSVLNRPRIQVGSATYTLQT